ncbi:MAG: tetratricopeptide repeat protein [Fibrobacterales bacterium]
MDYSTIFPHLDLDTIGIADLLFQRACISEILCEYEKAGEDFNRIQFLDDLSRDMRAEVLLHQALCFEQLKKYDDAKDCCSTALMFTFNDGENADLNIESQLNTVHIRVLMKMKDYFKAFAELNLAKHCGDEFSKEYWEECYHKVDQEKFMEKYGTRFPDAFLPPEIP